MTSSEALLSDARHGDSGAWTPQLWAILIVLGGALCLDALDVSMIGVALPSIRSALDLSTSSLQWIVSGYVLGYGGLLLLGGRAADLLGRRRVFLVALAVFAVVSLLGGLASDPGLLIAARFVKGVAAAFTAPASMSLLTTTFPEGPMRNRAFSVYTVFGASGQHLEVTDPKPVPFAELTLQGGAGGGVAGRHLPPGGHHAVLRHAHEGILTRDLSICKHINCACI